MNSEDDIDLDDEDDAGFELLPDWSTAIFGRPRDDDYRTKPPHLQECPFPVCHDCGGPSHHRGWLNPGMKSCNTCGGIGYLDVPTDPWWFEQNRAGSEGRVAMLTARYAAGLDLWSGWALPGSFPEIEAGDPLDIDFIFGDGDENVEDAA